MSLWRNQDQNSSQGTHEIEVLVTVKATALDMLKDSVDTKKVKEADLLSRADRRSPAKLDGATLMTLCKFYCGFLNEDVPHLVEELVDFHASEVNPRELMVSTGFWAAIQKEEALRKRPLTRLALVMTQYRSGDITRSQGAGQPQAAALLGAETISSFCSKNPQKVEALDEQLKAVRTKYLPLLQERMVPQDAKLALSLYMDLIVRCFFAKAWPVHIPNFACTLALGKPGSEKFKALGVCWAAWLNHQHPGSDWPLVLDLQEEMKDSQEDSQEVDISSIKGLKRRTSDEGDLPAGPSKAVLKLGQSVTLLKRVTWKLESNDKGEFRKDVTPGTKGVIMGWSDGEGKQVLFKTTLSLDTGNKTITKPVNPHNLMDTAEYLKTLKGSEADDDAAQPSKKSKKGADKNHPPDWLVGGSNKEDVVVETDWPSQNIGGADHLCKAMYLKGRISMVLQQLADVVPVYSEKDLIVAHRFDSKGIQSEEVWTARDFGPHELLFAPHSSQVKDTHITHSHNAVVGFPKLGRGAHPDKKVLALAIDGRSRNKMSHKEGLQGCLYWLIQRTSSPKQANLVLEAVKMKMTLSLTLPTCKKETKDEWGQTEMPSVPVIFNKEPIKARTRLQVLDKGK